MRTPGPWQWSCDDDGYIAIETQPLAGDIAVIHDTNTAQDVANARLIAAAPAYAAAWALVPDDIKGRIFNALHKPDTEWVERTIAEAEGK